MKPFRGTLLALIALAVLAGAYFALRPATDVPVKPAAQQDGPRLFQFEKSELVRIEVQRPDRSVVLVEKPDAWYLESEGGLRASRSMVNRVKHQIHDLAARATVVDAPEQLALYGLGDGAIHVTLTMRDDRVITFDAGDPNPSGVSFYIRPTPGDTIYTVKKSAVDYYALSLEEFRERRFATFDSKDVDALEATRADGVRLRFQRTGEHAWDMLSPLQFEASDSDVRSLMGRVSALKAIQFVTDEDPDPARYGLDAPRLSVTMRFAGRAPLTLKVGAETGELDGSYPLAYAQIEGEPTIYAVRDGLLEDYGKDPASFRLTRFVRMDANRVSQVVATWNDTGRDKDLAGTVTVRMAATTWMWDDGVPVPGSTPKRVATRVAGLESVEFVTDQGDDRKYGFDRPLLTVRLDDLDGATRVVVVGREAPSVTDDEGRKRVRYYARLQDRPEVYVVEDGVVDVVKDLLREHRRKATGDAESAERHERIEEEVGPLDAGKPSIRDRLGPPGRRPRPGDPPPTDAAPSDAAGRAP